MDIHQPVVVEDEGNVQSLKANGSVHYLPDSCEIQKSLYRMLPLDEAQQTIFSNLNTQIEFELIPLAQASRRILAEDVIAQQPHPPFRASLVDGYALKTPVAAGTVYAIGGESLAGVPTADISRPLSKAEVIYVSTGANVPDHADAVIPVERCAVDQKKSKTCRVLQEEVAEGQNIRKVGSDIPAGTRVLEKGIELSSAEIGVLATVGRESVLVHKRPRVVVLSTGHELDSSGTPPPHRIRDSNGPMLSSLVAADGAIVSRIAHIPDDKAKLSAFLDDVARSADVLISTGGVSMGKTDYMKPLLEEQGEVFFGRVNLKPGMPTTAGRISCKGSSTSCLVFALPGNPVSAWTTYHLLVQPSLKILQGVDRGDAGLVELPVNLATPITADYHRPEYHRCVVSVGRCPTGLWAASTGNQMSSRLMSSVGANGLLIIAASRDSNVRDYHEGSVVSCLLLGPIRPRTSRHLLLPRGSMEPTSSACGCAPSPMAMESRLPALPHLAYYEHTGHFDSAKGLRPPPPDLSDYSVAVLIVSDRCSRNEMEDKSGPTVKEAVLSRWRMKEAGEAVVQDSAEGIRSKVLEWVNEDVHLVVVSGGTGLAPRDVTPEALERSFTKTCTGIIHKMLSDSLQKTPYAALSRLTAGVISGSLVLVIPGSPKAVSECLEAVEPVLKHTLHQIRT